MSTHNHDAHTNANRADNNTVTIFDTSLRDGEQAPGFSMSPPQKLKMARALDALGVDVMEAGFPQASPNDFAAVADIAATVKNTRVCALARCRKEDIESAARALDKAAAPRIHVFIATSPIHREHKLKKSREEVIDIATQAVRQARLFCDDVEFSAEDGIRTERDFLVEVFDAVAQEGARTVNVPDTVGYTTPTEIKALFEHLNTHVSNADELIFSSHCHDDLGMAVSNSLAAVAGGARQVEGTISGIGERAGNASLEEVVMALRVRHDFYGLATRMDTHRLYQTARLLSQLTGQPVPRNKAIVGANAFAHESGIHQHGMLRDRNTYEIMRAEDVGMPQSQLVLGKHSGRAALQQRLQALGHNPDSEQMDGIFQQFKKLADRKREVFDGDLEALALGRDPQDAGPWHLHQLNAISHLGGTASASVSLKHDDGRETREAAIGDGPVNAVLQAVERAIGTALELGDFRVQAVSAGGDAQGQAVLEVHHSGREWIGKGFSTDIVEASAMAALDVANRIARNTEATQTAKRKAHDECST